MIKDIKLVKEKLHKRVLNGYNPRRDSESCEDHWADWFVLTEDEFEKIKQDAIEEKNASRSE
jgi:hypothetical protein